MKVLVVVTALLSACSAESSSRQYTGLLNPIAGSCDPPAQATLTMRGRALLFAPNSGTLVLTGAQDGNALVATQTLTGADRSPYVLEFKGVLHDAKVSGTYQNARCRYQVTLRQVSF